MLARFRASSPHLQNKWNFAIWLPCCNCIFLKLPNSELAALRETNRIRFGRIASLSAFVLFAGGCVVRIVFESFLDFCFSEFFMFSRWRTAVSHISLRSQFHLINTSVKEGSLPSIFKGCLALLSLRDISPHCGESSTSPSWASSTAVRLRRLCVC